MSIKSISPANTNGFISKSFVNNEVTPKLYFTSAQIKTLKDFPDVKSYALAFLGKKNYTDNEKAFLNFRKAFSTKIHRARREEQIAIWNFYINSNDENYKKMEQTNEAFIKIFQDEKTLAKLKEFKSKNITEQTLVRHLDDLIKCFDDNITYKDEIKALTDKENSIAQKFNQYRGKIDGVEYSNTDLLYMQKEEKNVEKRKKIYQALNGGGELIAKDLVELFKMRNDFAQKKGYSNYFSYMLKEAYKVDEDQLFKLLDLLESQSNNTAQRLFKQRDQKLAKIFNIQPEDLKIWHYKLRPEDDPYKEAEPYIKKKEDLLPLTTNLFERMGWHIDKLPIIYDIFPRENKNQHGFCFDIDPPVDSRIMANLREDLENLRTLNHETGHSVYDTGISSHIPYLDRTVPSMALTEAVAMLMESLPYREKGFLKDKLNMPEELIEKLDKKRKEDIVDFVQRYLRFINFEKKMYENPDQNLPKLWFDLNQKYNKIQTPDELNNEWATIPHFLSNPAYLQNYLRAQLMSAQIYKSVTDKLGPMTNTNKTEHFLRTKMFRIGASLSENEVMKKLTGDILKPDAFCEQIKDV